MGTRSLTNVFDKTGKQIICMYRQYDGYLEGHGLELARYLSQHKICNGIGGSNTWRNSFNGAGCMAASIVAYFKDDIGGFYLYPSDTCGYGEEFSYNIKVQNDDTILMVVFEVDSKGNDWPRIFEGTPEDFVVKFSKKEVTK